MTGLSKDRSHILQRNKQIQHLILQCYEIFPRYAKAASTIENITLGFIEVLKPYDMNQIEGAFKIWLNDENTMPTPACIKRLIREWYVDKSAKQSIVREELHPTFHNLNPEQQKEISELLDQVKARLQPDPDAGKVSFEERTKINTAHFDRHTDEQKAQIYKSLRPVQPHITQGINTGIKT